MEKICSQSVDPATLYRQAATQCARRECCRADFAGKWREKGVSSDETEKMLCQLEREGFIDENRYARAFAHDKLYYNKWGRNKMRMALLQKGISKSDISDAFEDIPESDYEEILRQVLTAKVRSVKATSEFEKKRKLAQFACGRGFEPHLVFHILDMEESDA